MNRVTLNMHAIWHDEARLTAFARNNKIKFASQLSWSDRLLVKHARLATFVVIQQRPEGPAALPAHLLVRTVHAAHNKGCFISCSEPQSTCNAAGRNLLLFH
jgi:hypothetical protein